MRQSIERQAIEHLLSAVYWSLPEGDRHAFFVGPPGSPFWDRQFGVTIYYKRPELIGAALFVRRNGPLYLRSMSVGKITGLLTRFFEEAFWYIRQIQFATSDRSFSDYVPDPLKE